MWNFLLYSMFNPFGLVDRRGTLLVDSTSVTVSATAVTIALDRFRTFANKGTILVNILQDIPEGTTETLPIVFNANGSTLSPTRCGNIPLTVADLQGVGVYQFYYDRAANKLQIISGASETTTTQTP